MHFHLTKRNYNDQLSLLDQYTDVNEEIKRTLVMGLYMRFKKEDIEESPHYSSTYIKQNPFMFEDFVADLFEQVRGGSTWVSPSIGDNGIDFEHRTEEGLFLG